MCRGGCQQQVVCHTVETGLSSVFVLSDRPVATVKQQTHLQQRELR